MLNFLQTKGHIKPGVQVVEMLDKHLNVKYLQNMEAPTTANKPLNPNSRVKNVEMPSKKRVSCFSCFGQNGMRGALHQLDCCKHRVL